MKKIVISTVLVISLISFTNLFAAETNEPLTLSSKYQKLSFDYKINSHSLSFTDDLENSTDIFKPNGNGSLSNGNHTQLLRDSAAQFSLAVKDPDTFSLKIPSEIISLQRKKKNYSRAAFEISSLNVTVWFFNKYIDHQPWADISLKSMLKNLRSGFAYDIDTYRTNQLGHPWHGAIHYSLGRANGLNFLESTICSTYGSYTWEVFLESIRPSSNDLILNTLGGVTLGEVLFKIGDLLLDENSSGFERVLRKSIAFILNPAYGIKALSGKAFTTGNPQNKHYYDLSIPFGAYSASNDKAHFLIAADLEYKNFLKADFSRVSPYDWFSFDCRLGIHDNGIRHKEIFTTGIIAGKRIKNGLAGLFGVFDYMESDFADRMSAMGVGPGLVTVFEGDSNLFFNSSGVLSLIYGGSSPSIDSENGHFGMKVNDPYYCGPGMLGKVKLEFGKKDFGSIETGFSQYWVHSIYTDADEFLAILSLNIKYDLSEKSQISLGYDYYLRHASLQERYFTGAKPAVRALYIYRF
ncbi:MAG: DUF3943 domain-containing protein [Candidatus Bathyarchaeota archaeon]|nr:DUF3943 domain-containing protein [Candidatus Bathyarchaeota archaeon]